MCNHLKILFVEFALLLYTVGGLRPFVFSPHLLHGYENTLQSGIDTHRKYTLNKTNMDVISSHSSNFADYYVFVGLYNLPRLEADYAPLFDGVIIRSNVVLTNLMYNSTVLTEIQNMRSQGFVLANSNTFPSTPNPTHTRFVKYARNYKDWFVGKDRRFLEDFERIALRKDGVQLALLKLNDTYDIDFHVKLLDRLPFENEECKVLMHSMDTVREMNVKIYSAAECKSLQPEYDEDTCFSHEDFMELPCLLRPGAPMFCAGALAGITRWTQACPGTRPRPYASIFKYINWINKTANFMETDNGTRIEHMQLKPVEDEVKSSKGKFKTECTTFWLLYISGYALKNVL